MAEPSSHNPSSPKITPKEEPVTLDKPESPNPFLLADQVEFSFEEIALITNDRAGFTPLANEINIDYASIFWEDIIIKLNKKHREKVVPYTRFLSLCMNPQDLREGYGDGELTLYPTQVFSVNNWALKPTEPEDLLLLTTSLAICAADKLSKETKGGSSKAPTSSKTGHSKKRKESSLAKDSNLSQPPVSTPVDTEMHKEDQQATGG
ncbi:hypothetical protein Tco_0872215 [Tanacetum coccineum]